MGIELQRVSMGPSCKTTSSLPDPHFIPTIEEASPDYAAELGEFVEIIMINKGLKMLVYAANVLKLYCFYLKKWKSSHSQLHLTMII